MTNDELRDRAAVALLPLMLQLNTRAAANVLGGEAKVQMDPAAAAVMAYQAADVLVQIKEANREKLAGSAPSLGR